MLGAARKATFPVWSFAKVPRPTFSPEENARLYSVYMRPWTLYPRDVTESNPLLSELGVCYLIEGRESTGAIHSDQVEHTGVSDATAGQASTDLASGEQRSDDTHSLGFERAAGNDVAKRRRITRKTPARRMSYAATWDLYTKNVVSETSLFFITNFVGATVACTVEKEGDASEDSEIERWAEVDGRAGNMNVVRKTLDGIAALSEDDGARVFGKHGSTIRLGRDLWQSERLPTSIASRIMERFFDGGTFPPTITLKKAVEKIQKADDVRPQPFTGKTLPYVHLTRVDYGKRIDDWFAKLMLEKEVPSLKQAEVLARVRERVVAEFCLAKEGNDLRKSAAVREREEEPLRSFIHGPPGTGKSRVILWIRRFFTEALGWEHGVEFIFVAFQNRVAYAMGGTTLHAGGDIAVGGQASRQLNHTDVDVLHTRNQHLRFVLADEIGMIPDDLLGAFAEQFRGAAVPSRYTKRADKSERVFGGYNLLMFGDLYQLTPIPASSAIFTPPTEKKTEQAKLALNLFWGDNADAVT